MAGEIYTTFTFLGGSGFAYGQGGPVYYILCYAHARLCDVLFHAAADLALRARQRALFAARFLRRQI